MSAGVPSMTYTSTSPWSMSSDSPFTKAYVEKAFSGMEQPVVFGFNGAFAFYSHDPDKAEEKGFARESIVFSNHYVHSDEEMYKFEVPELFLEDIRKDSQWTEQMKFVQARNSEAHIMLIKAAIFGDFHAYVTMWRDPNNAAHVKELGRKVRGFTNEKWFRVLPQVALEVIWQKFTKVQTFHDYLVEVASKHILIIEHTRHDSLWGNGADFVIGQTQTIPSTWRDCKSGNQACNILGWALMSVGHALVQRMGMGAWLIYAD